ncbi:hypothetical protein AC622_04255 [Bacillus sp. FJAT-27916]|uniref:hypothetical protein n=1 Tax=Bacillus sp. FJAT-27916 TaxID=1679169 RepID=UPI000670F39B|nr:hypothetical protein [Bacillus sp. FJAT-27916]KMY43541.1 hypothetical protein AC622_04255 [Bacillus sp. FJAT-27916]
MNTDTRLNRLLTITSLSLWSVLGLMFILSFAIPFTKPVFDFMILLGAIGLGLLLVTFMNKRNNVVQ